MLAKTKRWFRNKEHRDFPCGFGREMEVDDVGGTK